MFDLPPLNALRAFESAARCGSFVQAGQELGVSAPAVSLQVKSLEEHLGKALFYRKGNRIFLTDSGEAIYPKLAKAFGHLSEITQITQHASDRPKLVVSVMPALSELWLLPKVLQFKQETGISLELRVDDDPFDFVRNQTDVRFTWGSTFYEGYRNIKIFSDVAVPVCSPSFWDRFADSQAKLLNVPDSLMIHNNWGPEYATDPDWAQWMKIANSGRDFSKQNALTVSDTTLAIAAARMGSGMALVPKSLIARDLEKGSLVSPSEISLKLKKDYFCIFPNARAEYPALQQFLQFLNVV